jgi:hypothetical protein
LGFSEIDEIFKEIGENEDSDNGLLYKKSFSMEEDIRIRAIMK